ncbi:MAG: hypothetical protein DSZ06_03780 [Sulfurospirillum sp.]|nr:MAG: hypothetical protein DSZ06_03780 [Sulfurospirillum sp.]
MADFISQIKNIVLNPTYRYNSPIGTNQISTIIKNAIVDDVNFSQNAKNLFEISQIDSKFDEILGIPNQLTTNQTEQIRQLQQNLGNLYEGNYFSLRNPSFDDIFAEIEKLTSSESKTKDYKNKIANLSIQLHSYIQNLSISQLFGSDDFESTSIFDNLLANDQQISLGKIAQQLNRLLLVPNTKEADLLSNILNSNLNINIPDQNQQEELIRLLNQRNILLSSVLING